MRIPLTEQAQAEELIASSGPAWILKHSNSCSISFEAEAEAARYHQAHPQEPLGVVVVQTHRPLSGWLAQRLQVPHQSPQLFLVQAGQVLWRASHWQITEAAMQAARERSAPAGT